MGNDDGVEGHQLPAPAADQSPDQTQDMMDVDDHEVVDDARLPKWLSDDSNPLWGSEYLESGDDSKNGQPRGEEILRRLSLTDQRPKYSSRTKSRKEYSGLQLSGNIISATFCVPYKIDYGSGGEWVESGCVDC